MNRQTVFCMLVIIAVALVACERPAPATPEAQTVTAQPVIGTLRTPQTTSPPPTGTVVPPTATKGTAYPPPPTATEALPTATSRPVTSTAVPPTATSPPPTATPVPPTATVPPPTATPVPPTSTPRPPTATPQPAPARIAFAPGATSALIEGQLSERGVDRYILRAMAGQVMEVTASAARANVRLFIYGADGTTLLSGLSGSPTYLGTLPKTQDYLIYVAADGQATGYALDIVIPQRISFAPGATSAVVEGNLAPQSAAHYVLQAQAGQLLEVNVFAAGNAARPIIYGVDGSLLRSGMGEGTSFRGTLPTTQDYLINVTTGPQAARYTMNVIIPQRISFTPGATSAVVQGNVAARGINYYVLRALANQRMTVNVLTVRSDVGLTIYGADGVILKRLHEGGVGWEGTLPTTQDYWIDVVSLGGEIGYQVEVSIK